MEINTFGNFPAAIILTEEIINLNNKKIEAKVGRFMSKYHTGLNQLKLFSINNKFEKDVQIHMLHYWRDKFLSEVNFHPKIDTFVKNVIVAYFRKFIENRNK